MTISINYKSGAIKKTSTNLILFVDEKFEVSHLKKHISKIEFIYISDLLKNNNSKKKILIFEISSKKRIILVSIKKDIKN